MPTVKCVDVDISDGGGRTPQPKDVGAASPGASFTIGMSWLSNN